jgi:hypothetical protein
MAIVSFTGRETKVQRPESPSAPYPERCPKCDAVAGWPYAAGTCDKPGVILVRLRCAKCEKEWANDGSGVRPLKGRSIAWS